MYKQIHGKHYVKQSSLPLASGLQTCAFISLVYKIHCLSVYFFLYTSTNLKESRKRKWGGKSLSVVYLHGFGGKEKGKVKFKGGIFQAKFPENPLQ